MAIKQSIKGTTYEVLAAQAAGEIGYDTSVTITDNLYDSADLLLILGDTYKKITLQQPAGIPLVDSADNIELILSRVNNYKGDVEANTNANAGQLNFIAKNTTGKVTATLDPAELITKDTVRALKDVKFSDNISFTTAETTITGKDNLEALVSLSKIISDADFLTITGFAGTASEVNAIKAALTIRNVADVTINPAGKISAADANALAKATSGDVTATLKDGSIAATLKALKDIDVSTDTDNLSFTTTDKTAKASDIVALDDLIGIGTGSFTTTSVTTITGTAAEAGAGGDIRASLAIVITNPEVKITGTIDASDAAAISALTTSTVTANLTADTAFNLAAALSTPADDALNVTVNGATATVANLKTIDLATTAKIKLDATEVTAATFAEFQEIYVRDKTHFSNIGNENITIAAGSPIDVAQADAVAKATSGVAKATISTNAASLLVSNLKNANAKDAFTITVTGTASAKDLLTLDSKTSVTVVATAAATAGITGSVAEVNKLLAADVNLGANKKFDLTGTVKAADANSIILNSGTGVVTAIIAADTAAKLNVALVNAKATDMLKLTVNGSTASVTDLNALAGKTAVAADAIKVDAKEITGAGADLVALYANAKFDNLGNENVKVEGTVSVTNLSTILAATTSIVTASLTDTAANLAAITGATNGKDALTLKVINDAGATTAANLKALDGFTSVKVDASGITNGITGNAADLKAVITSKGIELAKGVDITVTGPISAADLNVILKSTLGAVTASVTDTAAKLNAALKDASSSDVLTLTLSAGTAAAKDLLALDGKTSVAVNASAVTAITGTFVDVQKVVDAGTAGTITLAGTENYTISGTVTAAQADLIATTTTGVVTATVAADTAANLVDDLTDTGHAYKLTVSGNDAAASDLNSLDGLTTVAVNANAIKNIIGTGTSGAEDVRDAYLANAKKDISGLGNETVNLDGAADADVALVNAINAYTTGVITLPDLVIAATDARTFNLKQLGDLKGITGLVSIDADTNSQIDTINISLKDLLEANDSKANFTLNLNVETTDFVNITNDVSGWTKAEITLDTKYTYTNAKTGQVVTIVADEAVINA